MQKDWLFVLDNAVCDLRVAAVILSGDKILLQKEQNGEEYALPGGHVHIGETLQDALVREFTEETGAPIRCRRLLWSEECFWEWKGRQAHNISFYYLAEFSCAAQIPVFDDFVPQKDNSNVVLGWVPLNRLEQLTVYPEFLKKEIHHLADPIKHFVTKG